MIEAGGHLDWWAEPAVSVMDSNHTTSTRVSLAAGSTCRIVEEVSLGRTKEPSGRLALDIRVERCGLPLVHHGELFGPGVPGAKSAVSVGSARHVLSAVLVGVEPGEPRVLVTPTCTASWLPRADDAAVILAVGLDRPSVMAGLESLVPELGA